MISYPSFLPLPQIDYSYGNASSTIQSRWESGRVSQRERFTGNRSIVKAIFKFDYFQLGIWEGFVANVLLGGSKEFQILLPSPADSSAQLQIVLLNSDSGSNYEAVAIAGELKWSVTCSIIIQDKKTISGGVIELLSIFEGDGEEMITFSELLHHMVHTTLPEDLIS